MRGHQAIPFPIVELSRENALLLHSRSPPLCLQIRRKLGLNLIPHLLIDNGFMLSRIRAALVRDLAKINSVLQHLIESTTGEDHPARLPSRFADPAFASDSLPIQMFPQLQDTAQLQIQRVNLTHPLCFFTIDDQMPVFEVIA